LKGSALRPEDGANFRGRIERIEDGRFRAECWAELDLLSSVRLEEPVYCQCNTRPEAEQWIDGQAMARGFARWQRVDD
jgi:hypothetical protein